MDNLSHRWEPDQFDPYLVMIGYIFNYYLVDNFFFFFFLLNRFSCKHFKYNSFITILTKLNVGLPA